MKRHLILLPLIFILTTGGLCHAGYAIHVAPQIPQWITVHGVNGPEQRLNPQRLHPDHVCKAPTYDQSAPEEARRTEIIRSAAGTLTAAAVLAICPTVLDAKYQRLWQAASDYERKNISGVALSLLTLGVSQGKPKALAIAAWANRLWNDTYYPCKALISLDTEPNCAFDAVGDMPYSVPELSAEVWGQ